MTATAKPKKKDAVGSNKKIVSKAIDIEFRKTCFESPPPTSPLERYPSPGNNVTSSKQRTVKPLHTPPPPYPRIRQEEIGAPTVIAAAGVIPMNRLANQPSNSASKKNNTTHHLLVYLNDGEATLARSNSPRSQGEINDPPDTSTTKSKQNTSSSSITHLPPPRRKSSSLGNPA